MTAELTLFYVMEALAVMFAAGLAGLIAMVHGNLRALVAHVWFKRWCTWTVIAAVILGALWLGGPAAVLMIAAVAWQSAREAAALLGLSPAYRRALVAAAPATVIVGGIVPNLLPWLPGAFAFIVVLLPLARGKVDSPGEAGRALLGYVWTGWLPAFIVRLGAASGGVEWLMTLGLAVALADVFACLIGGKLGGPKLAPAISPGKTWSGLGGAVVGAYAAFAAFAFLHPAASPLVYWGLPPVVAIAGTIGDLLESWVKRAAGVKDAGAWLPGFGGLLDRIDSALVALPVACLVLRILG
ncbi:MAG: phosphatidate cytidylyltransferase [Anaerolineae bacterium]